MLEWIGMERSKTLGMERSKTQVVQHRFRPMSHLPFSSHFGKPSW